VKRWIRTSVQGILALAFAIIIFFFLGPILQGFDTTAGVVDLGSLHVLAFGGVRFLFCTFLAWSVLQLDWKILDKYIDMEVLKDDWNDAFPKTRLTVFVAVYGILLLAAVLSCK
jgi:hypothetical protein